MLPDPSYTKCPKTKPSSALSKLYKNNTDYFDLVSFLQNKPLPSISMRFIPGTHHIKRPTMHKTALLDGRLIHLRATVTAEMFSVSISDQTGLLTASDGMQAFPEFSFVINAANKPVITDAECLYKSILCSRSNSASLENMAYILELNDKHPDDVRIMTLIINGHISNVDIRKIAHWRAESMNAEKIRVIECILANAT